MTPKNIKCKFAPVFAQFNTIEEITELANLICAQVKEAYDARKKELEETEVTIEATIEIEAEEVTDEAVEEVAEEVNEKPTKTKKSGSKTERAKEMAAKFKKEKAEKPKKEVKDKKADKTEQKKEQKKEQKTESSSETLVSIADVSEIMKLGLKFEKYNDRCYVLRGDTKPLRKILREEFKGVYNSRLSGGEGWVISAKHAQNCAKALGLKLSA